MGKKGQCIGNSNNNYSSSRTLDTRKLVNITAHYSSLSLATAHELSMEFSNKGGEGTIITSDLKQ